MPVVDRTTFFHRLKKACPDIWKAYTRHPFVAGLGDGTLPKASFRYYLKQDYIFLIHFSRAHALAAFKADRIEDIRDAAATVSALADYEMKLHIDYCNEWGITETVLAKTKEAPANLAYTRFVLERGMVGDLLDLQVVLAPCIVGYAEIGSWLAEGPLTQRLNNPYNRWIDMYSGEEYQAIGQAAIKKLDNLAARYGGDTRFDVLAANFQIATQLEIDFWQMGLGAGK
tara:strand:- start:1527 stop:2210 length:684 start_codon:yes stop_codon:yes gene_type:complete